MKIHYDIRDIDLNEHVFEVQLQLDSPGGELAFSLPAWIPGSYMIRDFARNVLTMEAADQSGDRVIEKRDKQTWSCDTVPGLLTLTYRVYAFDLSVRSAYIDDTRAYFNGTSLFLLPATDQEVEWSVDIRRPQHPAAAAWAVDTTMPAEAVDAAGFGRYEGQGYASLIDYPVEIGGQVCAEFRLGDVIHRIAVTDGGAFDTARIVDDLSRICAEHVGMFGELPVNRYLFLTLATADGYGGLEHLDSTSLVCRRADLPRKGLGPADKGYRQFLGLCSHEYFHLWNVKRIRPARFAPADLSREVHTELLWAFEGFTSYYDDLALARSGVIARDDYLQLLAELITRVSRGDGRRHQSVAESSFDAWTKFYKQDENASNAIVSYYAKGALVALGLDVTLRQESSDRLNLDDLMRRLWSVSGKTGVGLGERQIDQEVAGLLGRPLDTFFARYVRGTEELPLAEWCAALGIACRMRAARDDKDMGGLAADRQDAPALTLGALYESVAAGLKVAMVPRQSPAQRAGLSPGDVLLAIDAEAVTAANLSELLARGDGEVEVHYFRRGRLATTRVRPAPPPADTCELAWIAEEDLGEATISRREAWLCSNRRPGPLAA